MNQARIITAFLLFIQTGHILASQLPKNSVLTLAMGPSLYQAGQIQTLTLQPNLQDTYRANTPTSALFTGELFLGAQRMVAENLALQYGLAVATTSWANLSGMIWEAGEPQFDNFTYHYRITHTHIVAQGKLLYETSSSYTPYLSTGVGAGFNYAYEFSMKPLLTEIVMQPPFLSNMQTALSYEVGAGVFKEVSSQYALGLGYVFSDWGKSTLARANGQTMSSGLPLNHLYTHQFQVSMSYYT